MADKILPIVLKTGSAAPVAGTNLREGEPVYSKDLDQLFIGNGTGVTPTAVQMQGQTLDAKIGSVENASLFTTVNGVITSGTLPIAAGGTGITTAPTAGSLLIGKSNETYVKANLTDGTGMTITEGDGTITIAHNTFNGTQTTETETVSAGNSNFTAFNVINSVTLSNGHISAYTTDTVTIATPTLENVTAKGATSTSSLSMANLTLTGADSSAYLKGPATIVIDPFGHGDITGEVVIAGNLTVQGLTTTVESSTIVTNEKNIQLATVEAKSVTGSISGTTVILTVGDTSNLNIGQTVTGTSVTAGTYITGIIDNDQFSVNNSMTLSSRTLTIGGASDITAKGAGVTIKGGTDKQLYWDQVTSRGVTNLTGFRFNDNIEILAGSKLYADGAIFSGDSTVGSINKLTLTQPANGSTLTIADGKTLTINDNSTIGSLTNGHVLYASANDTISSEAILSYTRGGTSQSSWTKGDLMYASATNALSKLGVGTDGQWLKLVSGLPSWQSETTLSKATDSGSGTIVTDVAVSGHQITLTKVAETSLSKATNAAGSGTTFVTDVTVSGHQITLSTAAESAISIADVGTGEYISDVTNTGHAITLSRAILPTTLKNPTNLIIKSDSGTTESTNLYTYDGSTAKTLNLLSGTNVTLTEANVAANSGSITFSSPSLSKVDDATGDYMTDITVAGHAITEVKESFAALTISTGLSGTSYRPNATTTINLTEITPGTAEATQGALWYHGITAEAGKFDGSTTAPSGTTRLNYGGYLAATKLYSANISTYSTTDLLLNTNSGTNSGSITIFDGANGKIDITTNGTGIIDINGSLDHDGTFNSATTNAVISTASGEIDLTATLIDINGAVDISGATTLSGLPTAGFVKTDATGLLSVDTTTYVTTSDTIPTDKGGTNLTSFTSGGALYASSTSTLTTGTLPIESGGTGQTTLALARNAMGLGNTTSYLPVANGGTGSGTAANARDAFSVSGVYTSADGGITKTRQTSVNFDFNSTTGELTITTTQ